MFKGLAVNVAVAQTVCVFVVSLLVVVAVEDVVVTWAVVELL